MDTIKKEDVSAVEDLMREHGLLNRILIIYDEIIRRLENNLDVDKTIIIRSAQIIREFIENYHEKTEEKYVFPLLIDHNVDISLVNELLMQHQTSRLMTDKIIKFNNKQEVLDNLKKFVKLYRYHESREDTIIFPEFHNLLSKKMYEEYGELFEKDEDQKIGEGGFKKYLNEVIKIEKILDIFNFKE